ncbi:MAG TPA: hypothetical protein DEQ47_10025 [Solibacterales bacterium]|nr:hypothetical protein [Bryobacterales bacterium]
MFKTAANSLLTLVLLASYLWGGCVSCEQYFMLPSARHCCEAGKCKTPSAPRQQKNCERLALNHVPEAHSHSEIAAAFAATPARVTLVLLPVRWIDVTQVPSPSPRDLLILNASLLI